jgi:soluble lytic murein transglycosylase-like protein
VQLCFTWFNVSKNRSIPAFADAPDSLHGPVVEASKRFGIPEHWIRAVIISESGGDPKAVSPKGAMGLMQLMPDTWGDMRNALALGTDPFDPHANILAGTAYLKAMYDRFGFPALFVAYNAGPERYEAFLRTGQALPNETSTYVSGLGKRIALSAPNPQSTASGPHLFLRLSTSPNMRDDESFASSGDLFLRLSTRNTEGK